jgi:hypothetical protein
VILNARRSPAQIFLPPAIIAVIVTVGLLAALLGDGMWDMASWLALALPLAVLGFFLCKKLP